MFRVATLSLAAAVIAAGIASQAQATSVTYSGYDVLNSQTALIDVTVGGNHRVENAGSGQIRLFNAAIDGNPVIGGVLGVFCIDVFDFLQGAGSFISNPALLTGSVLTKLNALLSNVNLASSYDASSATQLAVWNIEYGAGSATSYNPSVNTLVATYLANVFDGVHGAWKADGAVQVVTLDAEGRNQNQTYLALADSGNNSSIPEPQSMLVLGAGLLAIGLTRRACTLKG